MSPWHKDAEEEAAAVGGQKREAGSLPWGMENRTKAGAYTRSRLSSTGATPGHGHELSLVIRWTEQLKLS